MPTHWHLECLAHPNVFSSLLLPIQRPPESVFRPAIRSSLALRVCFPGRFSPLAAFKPHNWPHPRKRKRLLQTVLSKVPDQLHHHGLPSSRTSDRNLSFIARDGGHSYSQSL